MTPEIGEAIRSSQYWAAIGVTIFLVALAVGLHYEVLRQLNGRMPHWRLPPHPRIFVMILLILATHVAEIWLFGFAIYALVQPLGIGSIAGVEQLRLLDAVYVSATTYSTLGYGDLVPEGPVRFLLGTESLVGFVMITWSASFAYLEMARYWKGAD
jgi:hypothetical protein